MRFGVIGGGGMAGYHALNLTRIPGSTLVACGSPEYSQFTRDVAAKVDAPCYATAAEVFARNDIDAVVIATPTDTHKEMTIAALQAGKHVFVEKPLARNLADATEMIEAATRYQRKLMPGQVVRYFREYASARDLVIAGEIGTPAVARTVRNGAVPGGGRHWYGDIARSGGVALDLLVHDYDWLRWVFGPAERVYAKSMKHAGTDGKDALLTIVRFASGVIAHSEASWAYPSGWNAAFELAGSGGLINHVDGTVRDITLNAAAGSGATLAPDSGIEDAYLHQLRDFAAWCAGGPTPRCVAEDGYEALRLSLAAYESAQTGKAITL